MSHKSKHPWKFTLITTCPNSLNSSKYGACFWESPQKTSTSLNPINWTTGKWLTPHLSRISLNVMKLMSFDDNRHKLYHQTTKSTSFWTPKPLSNTMVSCLSFITWSRQPVGREFFAVMPKSNCSRQRQNRKNIVITKLRNGELTLKRTWKLRWPNWWMR